MQTRNYVLALASCVATCVVIHAQKWSKLGVMVALNCTCSANLHSCCLGHRWQVVHLEWSSENGVCKQIGFVLIADSCTKWFLIEGKWGCGILKSVASWVCVALFGWTQRWEYPYGKKITSKLAWRESNQQRSKLLLKLINLHKVQC